MQSSKQSKGDNIKQEDTLKYGKLYLGTMVLKQAKIASSSIFGYHNLIKVKPL